MSDNNDEDKIHRIVNDKIEIYDQRVDKKITKISEDFKESSGILFKHGMQLTEIATKLVSIYGNGSGRLGILDVIKLDQAKLGDELAKVSSDLAKETESQASFRHELRNELETIKVMKASELRAAADAKKNNREWVKWVVGGLGFAIWELIKIYVLKVK